LSCLIFNVMLKAYEKQSLKLLLRVVVELAWFMCGRALAVCGRGIDLIVVPFQLVFRMQQFDSFEAFLDFDALRNM
jgi:hypothetical protein